VKFEILFTQPYPDGLDWPVNSTSLIGLTS